jgi:exopolyphosphatase/guanosine-5'-triphosphate,3'-diphosphate pyrophosphatase
MRVAAIDIGTNTVLLLVAERKADGQLEPVTERATITRLGEGVDRARQLAPAAIARTVACLAEYGEIVRASAVDRVAVVGTSAMRDARGGDHVAAAVRASFGVEPQVISGDAEAKLTFFGAVSGLAVASSPDLAVFDIGGGSTEVIFGAGGSARHIAFAKSFDVGSVRLTERFMVHDPPTPGELAAVSAAANAAFASVPDRLRGSAPIGVAGTVTTLAAVVLQLETYDSARVHGAEIEVPELERVVHRLAAMSIEARRQVPGIDPKRADVLVAGGLITLAILTRLRASSIIASDRGVRWGLAEQLAAS